MRDSTTFRGLPWQLPGQSSGLELFYDLEIAGSHAFVSYNAGFQIWDIGGAFAADPERLSYRDGWNGDFCNFEIPAAEADLVTKEIAYVSDSDNEMIALAGLGLQVGLTIWDVNNKSQPVQLYQDLTKIGRRVQAVVFNNQAYAFFGTINAFSSGGLQVYSMSAAANCVASPGNGCGSNCGGVYLGELGSWNEIGYLSVLKRFISGQERLFFAISDPKSTSLKVQIHEVTDLRFGLLSSRQVFSGLNTLSRDVELFEYGNKVYLAVKEPIDLKIFDVTACIDSNNCATLQNNTPVWSENIGLLGTNEGLVNFTQADSNNPFLYYGHDTQCLSGDKKERLLDLKNLGAASPVIPAVTDGGETYTDPGNGQTVDYWGTYYDGNTDGFGRVNPRVAHVRREPSNNTIYVYRIAHTLFDVHQFGGLSPPPDEPSATVTGPGEGWLGDPQAFTAVPQNCEGNAEWRWWTLENSVQTTIDASEPSPLSYQWPVGPDRFLAVGATRLACDSGETMADENVVTRSISLKDPRPVIPGIAPTPAGGTYAQGTQLTFGASGTIGGKSPFVYDWRVLDSVGSPVPGLSKASSPEADFDTCALILDPNHIFSGGFESGSTSFWDLTVGPESVTTGAASAPVKGAAPAPAKGAAAGVVLTVELTATSTVAAGSFGDTETLQFTVEPAGEPAFNASPAISSADLGEGSYQLTANTNGKWTEIRWEVEDDNGAGTCDFGAGAVSCAIFDWGEEGAQLTHQWSTPNTTGLHKVRATLRSSQCGGGFAEAGPAAIDLLVENITSPVPPTVTLFAVQTGGPASCSCPGFGSPCVCSRNQPVTFLVTVDGAFTSLEFDWDDGNVQTVSPAADNLYTHTYSTQNFFAPTVKAYSGGLASAPKDLPEGFIQIQ